MARPTKTTTRDAHALLLAAARELILTVGFANTSIDAINARAGLSKGTFYHYFKSKSELLDAVVDELTDEGWQNTRAAMQGERGGAIARFKRFMAAARRWRVVAQPQIAAIMQTVYRPENALLRERVRDRSVALAAPALAELLEEGNREGVFDVEDPAATAGIFLTLAYGVSDDQVRDVIASSLPNDELLGRLMARGRAFMHATEALLGLPRGALGGPEEELLRRMVRAFCGGDGDDAEGGAS